jgi:iron-sulfur cluster repair protein YtfE (RIC family)
MAAKKKSKRATKSPVTKLLEAQHRKVEGIFAKLEKGRGDTTALLKELSDSLAGHMAIEQDLYYPVAKHVKEDLVLESYEEHSLAELGLKRLLGTTHDDESFSSRVTACKELIQHHVEEEEEDLFPAVDKKVSGGELAALAKQMKARFAEVVAGGFDAAVPKGFAKTSADVSQS